MNNFTRNIFPRSWHQPFVLSFAVSDQYIFLFSVFLLRQVSLSPKLKCSGAVTAHCSLNLLGSRDPASSASRVAGITGTYHHTQLIFVFSVEIGFCHVGQAGVELLASSDPDPPTLAFQSVKHITLYYNNSLFHFNL